LKQRMPGDRFLKAPVSQVPCVLMERKCRLRAALQVTALLLMCVSPHMLAIAGDRFGTISGTVVDQYGKPVAGANVRTVGGMWIGGITDLKGEFDLRKVPRGVYTVLAFRQGVGRAVKSGIRVAPGDKTVLEFALAKITTPTFNGTYWSCSVPSDANREGESLVQIGVRLEIHADTCMYAYEILNRSRRALSEIRIGFDLGRDLYELTGAKPHAVPDTAFGPPGWVCVPVQSRTSSGFALSWRVVPQTSPGIPPSSDVSGFRVVLHKPDLLYSKCKWYALAGDSSEDFAGSVKPEREVHAISMATGAISGIVTDWARNPIPGATVSLWHAGPDTFTTSNGKYTLAAVPVGNYTLLANTPGYERCAQNGVRVAAGETTLVDFHLSTGGLIIPYSAYTTARERLGIPFPSPTIDRRAARVTKNGIELVYPGIGQDTVAKAFVATVRREFRSPNEERLLRIAEETYPPTKAVASLADERTDHRALLKEKRLWWFGEFDGVRLPYAVTLGAVRYYLGLTQAMGRGERVPFRKKRIQFSYLASVSSSPDTVSMEGRAYGGVYVVKMSLEWSDYCGSLCALYFRLDRTVLLRPDGTVVGIFGDRRPMMMVS
jgi:carboxypeptidase family protein